MPKINVNNIYVADGLAKDCEDLILKCSQVSKLSYEKFCYIWKELNFVCIFHGRQTGAELAEFSEEALHIAKHFIVSNIEEEFEKSVAALFLVYAILNLQPYSRFAALRLVPEDVAAIRQLERVARTERRIDILYILGNVLIKGPCQYHVSVRERGLDFCLRKYYDGCIQLSSIGLKPKGVFQRHCRELDLIKQLITLEKEYREMKTNLTEGCTPTLKYVDSELGAVMQKSLNEATTGVVDLPKEAPNNNDNTAATENDHHNNVQSIKTKALKNVVDPMRHLTGVHQRSSKPQPSTSKAITPPKSKNNQSKTTKPRRKSTPEKLKSPTRYPWTLKQIIDPVDGDQPPTSKVEEAQDATKANKDMVSIEIEPYEEGDEEFVEDVEDKKVNKKQSPKQKKRSPRKKPTFTKVKKLNFNQAPKIDLAKKPLKRQNDNTESKKKLIKLSIDKIPVEISENKNIEFEIIDQYKGQNDDTIDKPSTSNAKVSQKQIKSYSRLKKD